jgi:SAM-dependent methyltransferase
VSFLRRLLQGRSGLARKADFKGQYRSMVEALVDAHGTDKAMQIAVGGQFETIGPLQLEVLKQFRLAPDHYLIDVGCGSGRLAKPLSAYLKGRYLGIDIVPSLVDHARRITARDDWRFEAAEGLSIPERDGAADMVCFFSVFTHLLHEQSYVYLREAQRVLKPGGAVAFTFLDFAVPDHWASFESAIADLDVNRQPLNVFMHRGAILAWAQHLGLHVEAIGSAEKRFPRLAGIGQSICCLRKPGPDA